MFNPLNSIRTDERRAVFGAMFTLWGVMAGHALLETARDSLFLASVPAARLPLVYIGIALVALLLSQFRGRVAFGGDNRQMFGVLLLGSSVITLAFWALAASGHAWILGALYIWTGVFATLVLTRFWMLVDDVFTITQAKRLFAVIGAGSVLGAISGSGVARLLANFADPRHFLLVATALLLVTGLAPFLLLRRRGVGRAHVAKSASQDGAVSCPDPMNWSICMRMIIDRPYVQRLMSLTLVSAIVFTLIDYLFKSIVASEVAPQHLASFFSTTYFSVNVFSLLAQLTIVGAMMRGVGVQRTLASTPGLLAGGAMTLAIFAVIDPALLLAAAVGLKVVDGSLRYSLHRTSLETLFVPLTRELRNQVKTFIDVIGQRGGQAVGSLLILLLVLVPRSEIALALAVVGLCLLWIRVAAELHHHYLDLFRSTLNEGRFETQIEFPELDLASLETLISTLNSANDLEVLAALDILAQQKRVHLIPALILYHPSPDVVQRVLELFASHGRKDILPMLDRLRENEDPGVRAAALRTRANLEPDVNLQLKAFLDDGSPVVRATALVSLVGVDWIRGEEAERVLGKLDGDSSLEEKIALAKSIQQQPHSIYSGLLLRLARHHDRTLLAEVVRAMLAVRDERFMPALLQMLAVRELRGAARATFVAIGEPALRFLDEALTDGSLDDTIRRHIPRTLHRFEPVEASKILMKHLVNDPDGMVRYKILRALGALRNRQPDIPLNTRTLRRAAEATLGGAFRLVDWRLQMISGAERVPERGTAVHALLVETLRHKEHHARERIFRLLDLMVPEEDWERIYRGLESARPRDRSSSQELIEALLEPPLRNALLGFVDQVSDRERLLRAAPFYTTRAYRYEDILAEFLEKGSLGLRSLTLYHIGELGLNAFRPQVETLRQTASEFLRDVALRAIELLDSPEKERIL